MKTQVVVKGYKIEQLIEEDSFRNIYQAVHLPSSKQVFMTVISVHSHRDQNALKKRALLSQKLNLPSLQTALDYGILPNQVFFFTHEQIPSLSIHRVLSEINDPLDRLYELSSLMIKALEILAYIHDASLSHRNLQSPQLRVTNSKQILLEGFINPRQKIESQNLSTKVHLPYHAPEQLLGSPCDRKTDLYSMGVIFYELCTGNFPYNSNYQKIDDAKKSMSPSLSGIEPALPLAIERIIMRSLCPRKNRYSYARDWIDDLEAFRNSRPLKKKFSDSLKHFFSLS